MLRKVKLPKIIQIKLESDPSCQCPSWFLLTSHTMSSFVWGVLTLPPCRPSHNPMHWGVCLSRCLMHSQIFLWSGRAGFLPTFFTQFPHFHGLLYYFYPTTKILPSSDSKQTSNLIPRNAMLVVARHLRTQFSGPFFFHSLLSSSFEFNSTRKQEHLPRAKRRD